jgi:hypothetical protein
MSIENENYKIIAAVAFGAIGGLVLGNYLWGDQNRERKLSSRHISVLSDVLEQIEDIDTSEADDLKKRIKNIISTIEKNYVKSEE